MKKQTPVQWLYDQIGDTAPYEYAAQIASYLEQAMKMEKQEIVNAYYWGGVDFQEAKECNNQEVPYINDGEQYFQNTYGQVITLQTESTSKAIPELSDDEIERAASAYSAVNSINKIELKEKYNDFIYAAKWYREQLKQRQ